MHTGDAVIGDNYCREIWVLEEPIVRLFLFLTESLSGSSIGVESTSLSCWEHAILEEINVASVFKLDSTLYVLGSSHILDLDTITMILFTMD